MVLARLSSEWDRTANLLAMIHNVNCSRTAAMKPPEKFHPYHRRAKRRSLSPKDSVAALAAAFCVKHPGTE